MSIDNGEVKYYQPRFAKWIQSAKWDSIAERLSETSMSLITQVMNAEKDGDCSWIVWYECDHVLESIRKIANRLNCRTLNWWKANSCLLSWITITNG